MPSRKRLHIKLTLLLISAAGPMPAIGQAAPNSSFDPFSIAIVRRDADRFAKLMRDTNNAPSAEQIQRFYLDGSGRGVAVFTLGRIENATTMAQAVAAEPAHYRYAIDTCLPLLDSLNAELRAIYLAYRGLLPDRDLPTVHVVFGSANSGGTANSDTQVLGLEVMCAPGTSPEQFREAMRNMFAHETVHSWQGKLVPGGPADRDLLLTLALREGVPDYLASLVTGRVPGAERNRWALAREKQLWADFTQDRRFVSANRKGPFTANDQGNAAIRRWFMNYGKAPKGWPSEAGYWIGMRIAEAYVTNAKDRQAAIEALVRLEDPGAILRESGYTG